MSRLKLFDDSKLTLLVDDVLGEDRMEREAARKELRTQVELYVTRGDNIRLGPVSDDKEVRYDIFVSVMTTLEANNFARLGAWQARRLNHTDWSSFWGLVRVTTYHRSVDYGRSHPYSVGPRLKPLGRVREKTAPQALLEESLPARPFLADCTAQELCVYLDRFQSMHHTPDEDPRRTFSAAALPVPDLVLPEVAVGVDTNG